ncbi:MAG: hypothetical protein KAX05_16490, partial [Bacteroidales bacterium]|nr:hypothetical protein [Bacteroidales bacterium]
LTSSFIHSEICSFPGEMFSYLKSHPDTVILPCGAGRASVAFHVAGNHISSFMGFSYFCDSVT